MVFFIKNNFISDYFAWTLVLIYLFCFILVVEIISLTDVRKETDKKNQGVLKHWCEMGLVDWSKNRCCTAYNSEADVQKLTENDSLIGEDILAGFTIKITKFFEE